MCSSIPPTPPTGAGAGCCLRLVAVRELRDEGQRRLAGPDQPRERKCHGHGQAEGSARRNIAKARQAQSARAHGKDVPRRSEGMSTADKDRVDDQGFAFPEERKEPLTDAKHVRNAIARFDQVEGVSDAERDRAWERILSAARRFDVEVAESDWRDLAKSGKDRKRSLSARLAWGPAGSRARLRDLALPHLAARWPSPRP